LNEVIEHRSTYMANHCVALITRIKVYRPIPIKIDCG